MKAFLSRKHIIVGILILVYVVALPLTLYFSGAFEKDVPPDLKQLLINQSEFKNLTNNEKSELLDSIGFDLQAFEDGGFVFRLENIYVYADGDDPSKISYLKMEVTDEATYIIDITIYMPGAEGDSHHFRRGYERQEINGKAVGFYDPSDSMGQNQQLRYFDEQTGCVYYVEPFLGFNEIEYEFLNILI